MNLRSISCWLTIPASLVLISGAAASPFGASWTNAGPSSGGAVIQDGTTGDAVFSYTASSPNYGIPWTWRFQSTADETAALDLHYDWDGFHSWFQAEARLRAFVVPSGSGPIVYTGGFLFSGGVSGGFSIDGDITLNLHSGDTYGFELYGYHFDSSNVLTGTFTVRDVTPVATPDSGSTTAFLVVAGGVLFLARRRVLSERKQAQQGARANVLRRHASC